MNVQLIPEPFVEIPVELAQEKGISGADKIKVISARGTYIAKAFVTRRLKPMTIDGKKVYQIGLPIHSGIPRNRRRRGQRRAHAREPADARGDRSECAYAGEQGLLGQNRKGLGAGDEPGSNRTRQNFGSRRDRSGRRTQPRIQVCKLVDTTTCIGCKACEVACLEWNGYPFSQTTFNNSYQTMPETAWNYWNLIKFNEHEREDGNLMLLMRKDQCMHCADPGCLAACPADGAIVQYANGIVDFQEANCIGCGYCMTGCPFNIPKFSPKARKVFKCTMCNDRVSQGLEPACIKACPTGCLHFGTKAGNERPGGDACQTAPRHIPATATPEFTIRTALAGRTSSTCCMTRPIPKRTADCRRIPRFR